MTTVRHVVLRHMAIAALTCVLLLGVLGPGSTLYAFHFPWDQGHDTFRPTQPPNDGPCEGSNCNPCNSSSSPVYAPTGHFVWSDTDIALRGRPYLGITRTYNSNDPRAGLFGNGWSISCDVGLYATTSGSELHLVYRAPDGKRYQYVVQPDGSVTSPPGRFERVLPQPDGTVQILYLDNTRQVFRQDGRLTATFDANGNRLNYAYDSSDRLVRISDDNGRSLALTYNPSGRVATVADHGGRTWQYAYDSNANLIAVTDALGGVRAYQYAPFAPPGGGVTYQQLTRITDAAGVVVTQVTYSGERVASYTEGANRFSYVYNTSTRTVTKTDALGSRWTIVYNDAGLITQDTDPLGNRTTRVFDTNGRETSRTDALGAVWTATYDGLGRTLSTTNPLGQTTSFTYAGFNFAPVSIRSPSGRVTEKTYDSRLNPLTVKDPAGQTTTMQWSSTGDLVASVDPLGNRTSFTYDAIGSAVTATDPLLRMSRTSYDVLGRPITAQNPAGETTATSYDALDRVVQATDPLGNVTSYAYDAGGRLRSVTNGRGNTTTYDYDAFGRLVATTSPDGRVRRIAYRVDNLMSQVTLPDLRTIGYDYDAAKRLVREDAGGEIMTLTYSARGEVLTATGPGGSVAFTYDAAGRLIQETGTGQTVALTLNNEGEQVTQTVLGATTTYTRDVRGLATAIVTPTGSTTFAYDALGRRSQLTLPSLATTGHVYDAAGQVVSITHTGPFSTTYGYTFDAAGRIVRQTGDGADWQYAYDAAGRLTSAVHGATSFANSYDPVDNVLGSGRVYDASNRLTEDAGFLYSYDPNGNLIRKQAKSGGARTEFSWNAKNQLLRVERFPTATSATPTSTSVFTYDPLGRRVSKTQDGVGERYVYAGADLVGALDDAGTTVKAFTFGAGIDRPLIMRQAGGDQFFQTNHLGSVMAATSAAAVTASYQYDPYGATTTIGDTANPFRYTAREQDASDLYYYRKRYYDPNLQRFLSEDPVGVAGSVNAYSYAEANPISLTDPTGECPWCVAAVVGGLTDLGIQLLTNGFKLKCVNWLEVGTSAAASAVGVGIAQKLAQLGKLGKVSTAFAGPDRPTYRFLKIKDVIRVEAHPISSTHPNWLSYPHWHPDFAGAPWSKLHLPVVEPIVGSASALYNAGKGDCECK